VGTAELQHSGMLLVPYWPGLSVVGALVGWWQIVACTLATLLVLSILKRIPPALAALIVPLVGLVPGGRYFTPASALLSHMLNLLPIAAPPGQWRFLCGIARALRVLWIAAGLTLLACLAARSLTVTHDADFCRPNVGVNYTADGAGIGWVSADHLPAGVVTAGWIPFPGEAGGTKNLIRLITGDNLRRSHFHWYAAGGGVDAGCLICSGACLDSSFECLPPPILAILGKPGVYRHSVLQGRLAMGLIAGIGTRLAR